MQTVGLLLNKQAPQEDPEDNMIIIHSLQHILSYSLYTNKKIKFLTKKQHTS